jgi:NTE family protein
MTGAAMLRRLGAAAAIAGLLLLAGCASPPRTTELQKIDETAGYRYTTLEASAPKSVQGAAVILTFSGGGTRAAALADGALRALAETKVPAGAETLPLASQIDLISSVSGGSVTAASFALGGVGGLDGFERNFLRSDVMSTLIWRTLLDPAQLAQPRIDILQSYLDEKVFDRKTYADLIAAERGPGADRRPYVVLNAADMSTGTVFSFNQDQFDLICADLAQLKLADAVSASAAFPVALSALTLKNRAPCDAQRRAPATPRTGWKRVDGEPEPIRIANDRAAEVKGAIAYPAAENLARFRRGTVALTYLNRDGQKQYIQLLDGGIADNLGLTLPLTLLTSGSESPSFLNWFNTGKADKLLLLVVNARSQSANDFGAGDRPPGTIDTLLTTIGTPIDATTFQFLGHLDEIIDDQVDGTVDPKSLVLVDFDFIADAGCRRHFQNMATSWTLPVPEVDELIALGRAMVLESPSYAKIVAALGGTVPAPSPSMAQICAPYAKGS